MSIIDKSLNILSKNMGYAIILAIAIILFAVFSDGLIYGAITAISAVVGYTCAVILYREFTKPAPVHTKKKQSVAKKAKK